MLTIEAKQTEIGIRNQGIGDPSYSISDSSRFCERQEKPGVKMETGAWSCSIAPSNTARSQMIATCLWL
jgi:hypothetical protein